MSIGRPVDITQIGNEIRATASHLGLPRGQFPFKIRMSDEYGHPMWFQWDCFDTKGNQVYISDELTLVVEDDQRETP